MTINMHIQKSLSTVLTVVMLLVIHSNSFSQQPFISKWVTTGSDTQITLPVNESLTYNYDVDWDGDGIYDSLGVTGEITHDYAAVDTFTIQIRGTYPHIRFGSSPDNLKVISIDQWGDIEHQSMASAFFNCRNLRINATDAPDLSNVTSMQSMFRDCQVMNDTINHWDVSNVIDMSKMFQGASKFNTPLNNWNTSNVRFINLMFYITNDFNQPLNNWDVSKVERTGFMFSRALSFNQPLDNWNTAKVSIADRMFDRAESFDQNLGSWDISSMNNMGRMLDNCAMSVENYDSTLIGWSTLDSGEVQIPFGRGVGAVGREYCAGFAAHDTLTIKYNWNIQDEGIQFPSCNPGLPEDHLVLSFIIPNDPDPNNRNVTISIDSEISHLYNYGIDWDNDLTFDTIGVTSQVTRSFAPDDTVTIRINGEFPNIYFYENPDQDKLYEILQWGTTQWLSFQDAFHDCTGLKSVPLDAPDLSQCFGFRSAFKDASNFNQDLSSWDMSEARVLDRMFNGATSFDQDLGQWNPEEAWSMTDMLSHTGLSQVNYDSTLAGWARLDSGEANVPTGIDLGARGLQYCDFETRDKLITELLWSITDDGPLEGCVPLITKWNTTGSDTEITLTTDPSLNYFYDVDWNNDGVYDVIGAIDNVSHDFGIAGVQTIRIRGDYPHITFGSSPDNDKLVSIERWGSIEYTSMNSSFSGCSQMRINASDVPNLSQVADMRGMFRGCTAMNDSIDHWNVTAVRHMDSLFYQAESFNQPLSKWNTEELHTCSAMLYEATAFNQNIGSMSLGSITDMDNMLFGTSLSTTNYDNTLLGWLQQSVSDLIPSGVRMNTGGLMYCGSTAARESLQQDFGWFDFFDAPESPSCLSSDSDHFITTWATTNDDTEITLTVDANYAYLYDVDWDNDGIFDSLNVTGEITHDYGIADTFTIRIAGSYPHITFGTSPDRTKLLSVDQWGTQHWQTMSASFFECRSMHLLAVDTPDLSAVTNMANMLRECDVMNEPINHWDVSNVVDMNKMFRGSESFNQPLDNWEVGNVTNMLWMFLGAASFNQDINAWDVSKVKNMSLMFQGATSFNQPLDNWDVSSLTTTFKMFNFATSFNQDLGSWSIPAVTTMDQMFSDAAMTLVNYDKTLIGWGTIDFPGDTVKPGIDFDIPGVKYCAAQEFRDSLSNIEGWNINDGGFTSACTLVPGDGDLVLTFILPNSPDVDSTTVTIPTFGSGFDYAIDWENDLAYDDFSLSTSTSRQFSAGDTVTVRIGGSFPRIYFNNNSDAYKLHSVVQWGITAWPSMERAFYGCSNLTSVPSTAPNLDSLTSLRQMFQGTDKFNVDISNWDVDSVENFEFMFLNSSTFNQNLGSWNIQAATDLSGMLSGSGTSIDNYDATLDGWAALTTAPTNVTFQAAGIKYCLAVDSRSFLTDTLNWNLSDAGRTAACYPEPPLEDHFVTKWAPGPDSTILFKVQPQVNYINYSVDWDNDGIFDTIDITQSFGIKFQSTDTVIVRIAAYFSPSFDFNTLQANTDLLAIEQWGSIEWTTFHQIFLNCSNLVINATDAPDLSRVTNAAGAFDNCTSLTGSVNGWNVDSITNFTQMFEDCPNFTGAGLSSWNMESATTIRDMFRDCSQLSEDISNWNTSSVEDMFGAFYQCENFDANLGGWDISNVTDMAFMLGFTGLSIDNYDSTIVGWNRLDPGENQIPTDINLNAFGLQYCSASVDRQTLIDSFDWSFFDDQLACPNDLIMIFRTPQGGVSSTITIPTFPGETYNFDVDWDNDGIFDSLGITGDISRDFAPDGTYQVRVRGDFPRIYFNDHPDASKLSSVVQWGPTQWTSMANAFKGCGGVSFFDVLDSPDLSQTTDLSGVFSGCNVREGLDWNTSTVTNFDSAFANNVVFDQDLGGWDISSATSMLGMFAGTRILTSAYDSLLIGWNRLDPGESQIPTNIDFDAGISNFCQGELAHQNLIGSRGWSISDDDKFCGTIWNPIELIQLLEEGIATPEELEFFLNEFSWTVPDFWTNGAPDSTLDVRIPDIGAEIYPVVTGLRACKSLDIRENATITIKSNSELVIGEE